MKTLMSCGKHQSCLELPVTFLHQGHHPGKASIMFLPIIDMNPSDSTCIYSTHMFVSDDAQGMVSFQS